jgi:RHS repeat-associated protein
MATIDQKIVSGTATGTAVTRFNHTDNLGSTNVTSDATMNVAQWFDYAPYGSLIASSNTGSTTAARGYIGEFTDQSGLSYLNARYYNSGQGQFTAQDPVFWELGLGKVGRMILGDPQLLNNYAYAADNPITGKDADGRLVELVSRPLDGSGAGLFGHSFVKITPTNVNTIGVVRDTDFQTGNPKVIDSSSPFTLSGYTDGSVLYKDANAGPDYSRISSCSGCASTPIAPPRGVSDEDFEGSIVRGFNAMPKILSDSYGRAGQVRFTGSPNSNNAATTYLMQGGVSRQQINGYQSTLYGGNGVFLPGLGQSAYASTYSQAAQAQIGAILGQLASVLQQLSAVLGSSGKK